MFSISTETRACSAPPWLHSHNYGRPRLAQIWKQMAVIRGNVISITAAGAATDPPSVRLMLIVEQ